MHKRQFVRFEVEDRDEDTTLQLGHALQMKAKQPVVEFDEIDPVALLPKVATKKNDAAHIDTVVEEVLLIDDKQP